MSKSAVGKKHMSKTDITCPRDKSLLAEHVVGEATLDVCAKCHGQFFDTGEMFAAFGIKADPSYWDRPETGGEVKAGDLDCPRCGTVMVKQDLKYEGDNVEIDRCGKCGGIWLDDGEAKAIMAIGEKIHPILEAEKAKAKEELDKLGDVDFTSPGLIAKFLGLFKKKKAEA
jgi:Zn-finger nucleic acid-binding protein